MNHTSRTFVLVGIVVFLLLIMHQLPTLTVAGVELRHVNVLSDLLPEYEESSQSVIPAPKPPKPLVAVTRKGETVKFTEQWSKGVEPIVDYSGGANGGMDHFYQMLASVNKLNRPVRIAYFGDSFIEGDILSGDLRSMFQETFGGYGVGWVDCSNPTTSFRRTVNQKSLGFQEFAVVKKPFDKSRQGIAQRYYTVSEGAQVWTSGTKIAHCANWDVAKLFFRTPSPASITAQLNSGSSQQYPVGGATHVQTIETRGRATTVNYQFHHVDSRFTAFGMSLESERGVILDNFSMRGSSGITLANVPVVTLAEFARLRPYDLIILHFGLNVAVSGNTEPVLQVYVNNMKKTIRNLHAAFPEASILIVSVPDRDQRSADGITTLKEVKNLVALQQRLASECKVGFYNFYEAMGGEQSMKKLVDRNLANKDYTHLSFGGGRKVARKVFPSFNEGLKNYKRRKALEQQ
jgi:lysophospholipase L1-like esterase